MSDDLDFVQLATRVPKSVHRDVRLLCVQSGISMQDFITSAIAEYLRLKGRTNGNQRHKTHQRTQRGTTGIVAVSRSPTTSVPSRRKRKKHKAASETHQVRDDGRRLVIGEPQDRPAIPATPPIEVDGAVLDVITQPAGSIIFRGLADKLTKQGSPYWQLGGPSVAPSMGPPIWASEVDWLLDVFEDMADSVAPDDFEDSETPYPLAFRPSGTHALLLSLQRQAAGNELWIERWSAAQPNSGGERGSQYSTYWYRNFRYGTRTQLRVPLVSGWRELLHRFIGSWRSTLREATELAWKGFRSKRPELPEQPPSTRLLTVKVAGQAGDQRVPFFPFCVDPHDVEVLERPLRRVLLDACPEPRTARQVAQQVGALSETAVRSELPWTARYEDDTLREAAFLTLMRLEQVDLFTATRRLPSFLCDPMLTAIAPVPTGTLRGNVGLCPQAPEGLPLDALRKRGLIRAEMVGTALGDYPLPVVDEGDATRAAARPAARLRQERWRMLQWLDVESRCQANLMRQQTNRRVLGWQRLALLRHDCSILFADQLDEPALATVLGDAAERHACLLAGNASPATLIRSTGLP